MPLVTRHFLHRSLVIVIVSLLLRSLRRPASLSTDLWLVIRATTTRSRHSRLFPPTLLDSHQLPSRCITDLFHLRRLSDAKQSIRENKEIHLNPLHAPIEQPLLSHHHSICLFSDFTPTRRPSHTPYTPHTPLPAAAPNSHNAGVATTLTRTCPPPYTRIHLT